jgi:RNA polymerase sigma factor (sigma-70 family)
MFTALDTEARTGISVHRGASGALKNGFVAQAARLKVVDGENDNSARMQWVGHIARIRDDKDRQAFSEVFGHFAPRIKGFLIKSGADATMAEECAQEVMATVWLKAHMFDPARASVATWIFTIARNRRIDILRREKRPEPEDLPWGPEAEPEQADIVALQQESELLGRAMKELPPAQRELIEKAYFGDMTHSEIAAETGLPLGTIKSRIRLALDRLRHAMK